MLYLGAVRLILASSVPMAGSHSGAEVDVKQVFGGCRSITLLSLRSFSMRMCCNYNHYSSGFLCLFLFILLILLF
jgi:hypothetical protein